MNSSDLAFGLGSVAYVGAALLLYWATTYIVDNRGKSSIRLILSVGAIIITLALSGIVLTTWEVTR